MKTIQSFPFTHIKPILELVKSWNSLYICFKFSFLPDGELFIIRCNHANAHLICRHIAFKTHRSRTPTQNSDYCPKSYISTPIPDPSSGVQSYQQWRHESGRWRRWLTALFFFWGTLFFKKKDFWIFRPLKASVNVFLDGTRDMHCCERGSSFSFQFRWN